MKIAPKPINCTNTCSGGVFRSVQKCKSLFKTSYGFKTITLMELEDGTWGTITRRLDKQTIITTRISTRFTEHSICWVVSMFKDMLVNKTGR